jgi:glycosyltransferase involved in cell wall biosynthesis
MHGEPCCLWLGNLDVNKDPLVALAAFECVAETLSHAHLWMCWQSGPLLGAVRERVASSVVLRNRVHLLGALPHADVELALRAADFLLQASHREGSGYAVLEALACGTTPIVTDIPSFRRITCSGAVGALFRTGDVNGMARALVTLSAYDSTLLRSQARQHFEANLAFDAVGRELLAAYTQVASS